MRTEELRAIWQEIEEAAKAPRDPSRLALIDERLPMLWIARYEAEDVQLAESSKVAAVAGITARMRESAMASPEIHKNGKAISGVGAAIYSLLHHKQAQRGRLAWTGLALLIFLSCTLWYAFDLPGATGFKNWIAGGKAPKTSQPEILPERLPPEPDSPKPVPDKGEEPSHKPPSKRTVPNRSPKSTVPPPRPPISNEGTVLAQRIEVGKFASVMGEPKVTFTGERKSRNALPKMPVTTAMRIETGDADKAEIRFADGSTIALDFNTTVIVPADQGGTAGGVSTASEISVLAGRVSASIAHSEARGTFVVHTPVATAEVLGTEFSLALRRTSKSNEDVKLSAVLQVRTGRVAFYNDRGRVVAGAATESSATLDSAPTEPKRLATLGVFNPASGNYTVAVPTEPMDFKDFANSLVHPIGHLGFDLNPVGTGERRVIAVFRGSPASQAGLMLGDVIVLANGAPVTTGHISLSNPGETVSLVLRRNGAERLIKFTPSLLIRLPKNVTGNFAERLFAATIPSLEGDPSKSRSMLLKLAKKTRHPAIYNNLGAVYQIKDDLASAIRCFKTAIHLDPDYWLYHSNLGWALLHIGNLERAAEEFETAVRLHPTGGGNASVNLARVYMILGRHHDALQTLLGLTETDPRPAVVWIRIADNAILSGDLNRAETALSTALHLEPENYSAYDALGRVLFASDRYNEAEAALLRAIELGSSWGQTHTNLGATLSKLGKLEGAESAYRTAVHLEPQNGFAFVGLGDILRKLNRYDEAETAFRSAIELDRKNPDAFNGLGIVFQVQNKRTEAEAEFRKALALNPNHIATLRNLAYRLEVDGRLDEAVQLFESALKRRPREFELHYGIGRHYFIQGRLQDSELALRKAIDINSLHGDAQYLLGLVFIQTDRFREAEPLFRKAIDLNPLDGNPVNGLGIVFMRTNRAREAIPMFRRAAELSPTNVTIVKNLLAVVRENAAPNELEPIHRRIVELEPNMVNFNELAWFLASHDRSLEDAVAYARKGHLLAPEDPDMLDTFGYALSKHGELTEAIAMFDKAIHFYGANRVAAGATAVRLAAVYEKKGDIKSAIEQYRRAIGLDPGQKEAKDAIKRLGG